MTYKIRCTVSGVIGYRSSYLKSNEVEVEFDSLEAAQTEARKLQSEIGRNDITYVTEEGGLELEDVEEVEDDE